MSVKGEGGVDGTVPGCRGFEKEGERGMTALCQGGVDASIFPVLAEVILYQHC